MFLLSRILKVGCVLGLAMLMASCAIMSPEDCQNANWYELGQRDGLVGSSLNVLSARESDCAKASVAVDTQAYNQGRDLGLNSYCRLENAIELGLRGAYYGRVCPPAIDVVFQQRHQMAYAVYYLRTEINNLNERTGSLEHRLRESGRKEDDRLRDAHSDDERSRIRREADNERNNLRDELRETDRRLHRKREELRSAEYDLSNLR